MSAQTTSNVLSVTELTSVIRNILESDKRLVNCYVAGEISNFKHHASGHMYFTLKDEKSRIRAVMFAGRNRHVAFTPEDGMRVIARGSISVFDRDGTYQMYVDDMQPDGVGALYVAFTQLKGRLESEGLFALERKRTLPPFPRRIGVVTSPTGAVIRDICSTLRRRYPLVDVILAPALVQGVTAAATIVNGIERLVRHSTENPIDVIIVARGGGSLEELWPFNEEVVARAVAASPIPVVSAVGHETDFTICDFVADVRAATPTGAAELVAPYVRDLNQRLDEVQVRMRSSLRLRHSDLSQRVHALANTSVLRHPQHIFLRYRQHVDYMESQIRQHVHRPVAIAQKKLSHVRERLLQTNVLHRVTLQHHRLDKLTQISRESMTKRVSIAGTQYDTVVAKLEALNPLGVLRRGYSLVYKSDEKTVVSSHHDVIANEDIRIRVADGMISARVLGEEDKSYERNIQSKLDI